MKKQGNIHYYIDGYNLLFRKAYNHEKKIADQRELMMHSLSEKIALLNLEVTMVFDAAFQQEDNKERFLAIDTVYTGCGMSADDYIVEAVTVEKNPKQVVVVTSDKQLAWRCRHLGVKTESVEAFIKTLNKHFNKRKGSSDLERLLPLPEKKPSKTLSTPLKFDPHQYDYLEIFEKRYQDLQQQEKTKKNPKRG